LKHNTPQDVIVRAQQGSPDDVGWLYTAYHQNVYRYLYYRTGDLQTAEDLTEEVFVKMVQALPAYRIEAAPFIAWLFQIARNVAIDHYRKVAAHPMVQLDEGMKEPQDDLVDLVEKRLTSEALARGLARLDENHRDVLVLRFIERLPIAATAQTLHKTEDAVKALQRRGLYALRTFLNHWEKDHG
jgi:RNA polymerase sigma-70 factor (ECF subfamily)